MQCGILSETIGENEKDPSYQPARDVDTLSISYVMRSLDGLGVRDLPFAHSMVTDRISESIKEFTSIIENSKANLLLKDIH